MTNDKLKMSNDGIIYLNKKNINLTFDIGNLSLNFERSEEFIKGGEK